MTTKNIDYESLKRRGFLKQRQDGFVILRTRTVSGVYKKEDLQKLSEIAEKYGKGIIHPTTRQGLEIPFVKVEDVAVIEKELEKSGIALGTSGARLRAVTACPGNNWCRFGLINTFALGERIEKELGIKSGMDLPHKFKIAISGCPNTCTRPQSSDIGIHGYIIDTASAQKHAGYIVYIGGNGGRNPKDGIRLDKVFTEDEVLALVKKIVDFFKDRAKPKQRFALLIEEIRKDRFLKELMI
jgi:dissimilatory sulfite reductase (desulfoviridin) alpha/beta subunit